MAEHARKMASLMTFLDDSKVLEAFKDLVTQGALQDLLKFSIHADIRNKAASLGVEFEVVPEETNELGVVVRPQYLRAALRGAGTGGCDFVQQMTRRASGE